MWVDNIGLCIGYRNFDIKTRWTWIWNFCTGLFWENVRDSTRKNARCQTFIGDISNGLVEPLLENKYDAIIATYSLHHLTDDEKVTFLKDLLNQLNEGGVIYIGDVAFETSAEHDKYRNKVGEAWDEEEFYFIADEMKKYFPEMKFEKLSDSAGLITLKK